MRLIDADAFIKYIKETSEKLEFDKFHVDSAVTAKIILDGVIADLDGTSRDGFKNAPTIELERKKGKWVYDGIRGRFPACKCSICGHYENADWALLQGANFCPNCGADMRGDHE